MRKFIDEQVAADGIDLKVDFESELASLQREMDVRLALLDSPYSMTRLDLALQSSRNNALIPERVYCCPIRGGVLAAIKGAAKGGGVWPDRTARTA
jgi:hypothetical protein